MRLIKRLLLFAAEVGLFLVGVVLSLAVAEVFFSYSSVIYRAVYTFTFWFGLLLTFAGVLAFRRKTRRWKIESGAIAWQRSQARRKLHPARARFISIAQRTLLWLPAAFAAFVLCFLPVATHLVHPCSHYLSHYRIPFPWTTTAVAFPRFDGDSDAVIVMVSNTGKGRFGVTPFWDRQWHFSLMTFHTSRGDSRSSRPAHIFGPHSWVKEVPGGGSTKVLSREFHVGMVAMTCWPYEPSWPGESDGYPFGAGPIGAVDCGSAVDVHGQSLIASFIGHEEDIAMFYRVIEGITPVE